MQQKSNGGVSSSLATLYNNRRRHSEEFTMHSQTKLLEPQAVQTKFKVCVTPDIKAPMTILHTIKQPSIEHYVIPVFL